MAQDQYDISSNNTLDRREMQCPRCWEYRLREDPDRADEFSGKRDKLVYATKCTNEACPLTHIDPDDIRAQMPSQNLFQQFVMDNGVIVTGFVILVIGIVVSFALFFTGGGGAQPVNVHVTVHNPVSGATLSGVSVQLNNSTQRTNANGRVVFKQIPPGEYTVRIHPNLSSKYAAPPPATLVVANGGYTLRQQEPRYSRTQGAVAVSLPQAQSISLTRYSPDGIANLTFATPYNARRGVTVTLHGPATRGREQTLTAVNGTPTTFTAAETPAQATITVSAPVVTRQTRHTGTYTGIQTVAFDGTLKPANVTLHVDAASGQYPEVRVARQTVCSKSEMAATSGRCQLPPDIVGNAQLTFELVGGSGLDYTVTYLARATPESVSITVNGAQSTVLRRGGTVGPNGEWANTFTTDRLTRGQNRVVVATSRAGGIETRATANITYTRTRPAPESPAVVVVDGKGNTHSAAVPAAALTEDGVLLGTYTMTVDPSWFTAGRNQLRVKTDNDGLLAFKVSAETSGIAASNSPNSSS